MNSCNSGCRKTLFLSWKTALCGFGQRGNRPKRQGRDPMSAPAEVVTTREDASMTTEILCLTPGYRLRVVDLMREIEIAENFTLAELCLTIRDSEEIDLDTL